MYCTLHCTACSLQVCLNRVPVSVLGYSHSYHDILRPPGHLLAEPHNYESCGASDAVLPIRFAIPITFRAADGAGNERLSAHAHARVWAAIFLFVPLFTAIRMEVVEYRLEVARFPQKIIMNRDS